MWVIEVQWRYKWRENKVQTKETKGKHDPLKPLPVKGFRNKKTQNKILGFVPRTGRQVGIDNMLKCTTSKGFLFLQRYIFLSTHVFLSFTS